MAGPRREAVLRVPQRSLPDQLHERARALAASLGSATIVTTQMALVEVLDHLAGRGERHRGLAVQMVQDLGARPTLAFNCSMMIGPNSDAGRDEVRSGNCGLGVTGAKTRDGVVFGNAASR